MAGQKAYLDKNKKSIVYQTPEQEDLINQIESNIAFDENLSLEDRLNIILRMINNPDSAMGVIERKPMLQERPTAKSIDQIIQEADIIEAFAPKDKTNVESKSFQGETMLEKLLKNPRVLNREPIPEPDIIS
jgi:hypothetical protein